MIKSCDKSLLDMFSLLPSEVELRNIETEAIKYLKCTQDKTSRKIDVHPSWRTHEYISYQLGVVKH